MNDDRQTLRDVAENAWDETRGVSANLAAVLDALLADPVPLLREIAAATKPCETCGGDGSSREHWYSNVSAFAEKLNECPTCDGSGRVPAVDRAALLAALGMERTNGFCTKCGWSGEVTDDPKTWFHDGCNYAAIQVKESWAARVSEEGENDG